VGFGVEVAVGILVAVGSTARVSVGAAVDDGRSVGPRSLGTTGVQVGGIRCGGSVADGSTMGAGSVGGGKGLKEESGLIKICKKKTPMIHNASKVKIERISQKDIFMVQGPFRWSAVIIAVDSIAKIIKLSIGLQNSWFASN
jgi:hypothetical protein